MSGKQKIKLTDADTITLKDWMGKKYVLRSAGLKYVQSFIANTQVDPLDNRKLDECFIVKVYMSDDVNIKLIFPKAQPNMYYSALKKCESAIDKNFSALKLKSGNASYIISVSRIRTTSDFIYQTEFKNYERQQPVLSKYEIRLTFDDKSELRMFFKQKNYALKLKAIKKIKQAISSREVNNERA